MEYLITRDTFSILIQYLCTRDTCMLAATCRRFCGYWKHILEIFVHSYLPEYPHILQSMTVMSQIYAESRQEFVWFASRFMSIPTHRTALEAHEKWTSRYESSDEYGFRLRNRSISAVHSVIEWNTNKLGSFFNDRKKLIIQLQRVQATFRASPELMNSVSFAPKESAIHHILSWDNRNWFIPDIRQIDSGLEYAIPKAFPRLNIVGSAEWWVHQFKRIVLGTKSSVLTYQQICTRLYSIANASNRCTKRARKMLMSTGAKRRRHQK